MQTVALSALDRYADYWLRHQLLARVYKKYVNSLGLVGNETVLDFGCGSGASARHIAAALARDGGRLVCCEPYPEWLALARRRLRRFRHVAFVEGGAPSLKNMPDCFDAIHVHFFLHTLDPAKRLEAAAALARSLSPSGSLFIREPIMGPESIDVEEIREMMKAQALKEDAFHIGRLPFAGRTYSGVFVRDLRNPGWIQPPSGEWEP